MKVKLYHDCKCFRQAARNKSLGLPVKQEPCEAHGRGGEIIEVSAAIGSRLVCGGVCQFIAHNPPANVPASVLVAAPLEQGAESGTKTTGTNENAQNKEKSEPQTKRTSKAKGTDTRANS